LATFRLAAANGRRVLCRRIFARYLCVVSGSPPAELKAQSVEKCYVGKSSPAAHGCDDLNDNNKTTARATSHKTGAECQRIRPTRLAAALSITQSIYSPSPPPPLLQ